MDHQNQVSNTFYSPDGTIKRKRGRPRKNPSQIPSQTADVAESFGLSPKYPPGFEEPNGKQPQGPQSVGSVNENNMSPMVGEVITGVIESDFEGGYLISVRVGSSDNRLSGVIFKSGHYVPVVPENDLAPGAERIRTNKMPLPANNETRLAPDTQRIGTDKRPSPANNEAHLVPGVERMTTNKMPLPANNETRLAPDMHRIGTDKRPSPANNKAHLAPGIERITTNKMPSPAYSTTNKMPSPAYSETNLVSPVRRIRTSKTCLPANNGTRENHAVYPSNSTPAWNQGTWAQSRQMSIKTVQASTLDPLEGRGTLVPVVLQSDNLSTCASPAIESRRIGTQPAHLASSYVDLSEKPFDEMIGVAEMMNVAPLSTETRGNGFYFNQMLGNDSSFTQNGGEDLSKPIQTVYPDMPSVSGKMTELLLAMQQKDPRGPQN